MYKRLGILFKVIIKYSRNHSKTFYLNISSFVIRVFWIAGKFESWQISKEEITTKFDPTALRLESCCHATCHTRPTQKHST